jgi:DNA-directed RNA polymerase specialized sigma24 family protein
METHRRGETSGLVPIVLDEEMRMNRAGELAPPADEKSPDRIFDQQWALAVLERVLTRLREEHRATGRGEQFERLQCFLVENAAARSQAEIAGELETTESAVKQAVFRLRQRYRKLLRAEVADTVAMLGDVEEELRDLARALRG